MKQKFFVCCFLLLIGQSIFSQNYYDVYRQMFDKTKPYIESVYNDTDANEWDKYGDGYCYSMEAYLRMYEATGDVVYLNDFVKSANDVIKNRDDYREVYGKPYWTSKNHVNCSGPITYQTGLILWSMAHYIYLSNKVYNNVFNSTTVNPANNKTFDNVQINTFSDFAQWLYTKIDVTVTHYDQYYWINNIGYRQYSLIDPCMSDHYIIEGTNRQMDWGCTMIYLALAFQNTSNPKEAGYFDKAQTIAYQQKNHNLSPYLSSGGIPLYFWYEFGWSNTTSNNPDDISHGSAAIEFMFLCNKYKDFIKSTSGGCCVGGYITDDDMKRLANDMIYRIYADPLKYHNDIRGDCYFWKCYSSGCSVCDYNIQVVTNIARWLRLSNVQASYYYNNTSPLYNIVSDYYSTFLENPNKADFVYAQPQVLLGYANAYDYQKTFCFLGRNSTPGGIHDDDWQSVAGGDFNNNGKKDEFITVRNSDGGFYFYKIENNTTSATYNNVVIDFNNVGYKMTSCGSYISGGVSTGALNSKWKGITAGHFTNDFVGDQVAVIRNYEGNIYVWKVNNNSGTYSISGLVSSTNAFCPNKNWAGITATDIDKDGINEIAAIRSDGKLYIWNVAKNGSTYFLNTLYSNFMGGSDWAAISSGDIDNDGSNEIVGVRNSDGYIFIWNFIKNSNQFVLTSSIVDNSFYANNNYWNGITIGDYNSDGKKEMVVHRNADGAFFTKCLSGSVPKHLTTDYFPVNQDLKVFGTCQIGNKDVFLSLRNADGDIMLYSLNYVNPYNKIFKDATLDDNLSNKESDDVINESYKDNAVVIYPNPANDLLTIELTLLNNSTEIKIYNINGQIVKSEEVSELISQIDISSLPIGIYCLKLKNNDTIVTRKFIKQ